MSVNKVDFQNPAETDVDRNQNIRNKNITDNYHLNVEFSNKITDSLSVEIGGDFRINSNSTERKTFDFNDSSQ